MAYANVLVLAAALVYLLANLAAGLVFALDKHRAAVGGARVPERSLLLFAVPGPFGALAAMRLTRHKTRKVLFLLVPLFALAHLALIIWALL